MTTNLTPAQLSILRLGEQYPSGWLRNWYSAPITEIAALVNLGYLERINTLHGTEYILTQKGWDAIDPHDHKKYGEQ